jgi:hypothetical protein
MRRYRLAIPVLLGLSLAALVYRAPEAMAAAEEAQPTPIAPGLVSAPDGRADQ